MQNINSKILNLRDLIYGDVIKNVIETNVEKINNEVSDYVFNNVHTDICFDIQYYKIWKI